MKHIKQFEELKYDTYRNAADKLSKMGTGHAPRVKKLIEWSHIKDYHKYGTFNVIINAKPESVHWKTKEKIPAKPQRIAECYIDNISIDDMTFYESCIAEKEDSGIGVMVSMYEPATDYHFTFLVIHMPIAWQDDKFYLDCNGESVEVDKCDEGLFADRKSAMKFKKVLNEDRQWEPKHLEEGEDEDLNVRNIFMLYSTEDELEKMIALVKGISVQKLM